MINRFVAAMAAAVMVSPACGGSGADSEDDGGATSKNDGDVESAGAGGQSTGAGGHAGAPAEQPVEPTCDQTCDNLCTPHDPCTPKPAPSSLPTEEWVNGFVLVNYEYWPYDNGPPSYPDDIGWSYVAGSEPAEACMAEAFEDLVQILQDPPDELLELKKTKNVYAFYLWNNDYTGARENGLAPEKYRHLWLYTTEGGGYLIKWISETNNDGTCILPTRDDLIAFASGCIDSHPNCNKD
jgi:hypothetical protein